MDVETYRPFLPAPTDGPYEMDNQTDIATDISRRTDRTSYSIPEDGSPITISTTKFAHPDDPKLGHRRQKSQTSLLIEYFEASKTGDKSRTRPSVRVKVTPSAARKARGGSDAVQITGIGKDRKPSYTRRISLGSRPHSADRAVMEGTELSRSDESTISRPPVEVEVLDPNASDISKLSRDLRYFEQQSNVSSLPPDSFLDQSQVNTTTSRAVSHNKRDGKEEKSQLDTVHLEAPSKQRTRSLSRERIAQKVMEKLAAKPLDSSPKKNRIVEYEPDTKPGKDRRRRRSRSHQEEYISPPSSQVSYNVAASQASYRSGGSKVSLTNPRLLEMVEDTVKRLILPEVHQMRKEQRSTRNDYDDEYHEHSAGRHSTTEIKNVSKSTSTPNIRSKPKVVLNRYDDDPGEVLSRGDSSRKTSRRHSRDMSADGRHSSLSVRTTKKLDEASYSKSGIGNAALGALAAGALTAAVLEDSHNRKRSRSRSRTYRTRNGSVTEPVHESRADEYNEVFGAPSSGTKSHSGEHLKRSSNDAVYESRAEGRQLSFLDEPTRSPISEHREDFDQTAIRLPFIGAPTESDLTRASIVSASTAQTSQKIHDHEIEHSTGSAKMNRQSMVSPKPFSQSPESSERHEQPVNTAVAGIAGASLLHHLTKEDSRRESTPIRRSPAVGTFDRTSSRANIKDFSAQSPRSLRSPVSVKTGSAEGAGSLDGSLTVRSRSRASQVPETTYATAEESPGRTSYFDTNGEHDKSSAQKRDATTVEPDREKRLLAYVPCGMSSAAEDDGVTRDLRHVATNPPQILHGTGVRSVVASLIDPSADGSRESIAYSTHDHGETEIPEVLHERIHDANRVSPDAYAFETAGAFSVLDESREDAEEHGAHVRNGERFATKSVDAVKDRHNERTPEKDRLNALELAAGTFAAAAAALGSSSPTKGKVESLKAHTSGLKTTIEEDDEQLDVHSCHTRDKGKAKAVKSPISPSYNEGGYDSAERSADTSNSRSVATNAQIVEDEISSHNILTRDRHTIANTDKRMSYEDSKSPFYESAASEGMDRIHSGDIVALMEHLTVRDGLRNARDTEILMTLLRSAAEMRENFDDLKRTIADQGRTIMNNSDRNAAATQKVVSGKTMRDSFQQESRTQRSVSGQPPQSEKRPNLFKRALKGLGSRNSNDLARMEDMLERLLDEVEDLKEAQLNRRDNLSFEERPKTGGVAISSYEALRATDFAELDKIREDDDKTPTQRGQFKASPRSKQIFHSGYDGRPDSINRVSTVMEGDEGDGSVGREEQLTPRPLQRLKHASPRLDDRRQAMVFDDVSSPYQLSRHEMADVSPVAKHRKHASNGSSTMSDPPKISRWSKTTASSGEDALDYQQDQKRMSFGSLSNDSLQDYDHGVKASPLSVRKARDLETSSLRSSRSSLSQRPASPLIPSDVSGPDQSGAVDRLNLQGDDFDIEGPHYQAIRNSLILEHPQPRQGQTDRHQTNLESAAHEFDPVPQSLTGSDLSQRSAASDFDPSQWGSDPALSLSRAQKLGRIQPMPPSPQSPQTLSSRSKRLQADDGPLVPVQTAEPARRSPEQQIDTSYQRSQAPPRSFDRLYYNSPLGSGHLLEPIEEVRYSLETDRGHVSPVRESTPDSTPKVGQARLARKITGPRPMVRNVSGKGRE